MEEAARGIKLGAGVVAVAAHGNNVRHANLEPRTPLELPGNSSERVRLNKESTNCPPKKGDLALLLDRRIRLRLTKSAATPLTATVAGISRGLETYKILHRILLTNCRHFAETLTKPGYFVGTSKYRAFSGIFGQAF